MEHFSKKLLKFSVIVGKYYIKKALGDEASSIILNGLSDIVGETASEKIENFIIIEDKQKKINSAFIYADECFKNRVDDRKLKQVIISLPFAGIENFQNLILDYHENLNDEKIYELIKVQFTKEWGKYIEPSLITKASKLYQKCLDEQLSIQCGEIINVIYRKIESLNQFARKSEINQNSIYENTEEIKKGINLLDDKFEKIVPYFENSKLPIADSIPRKVFPYREQINYIEELVKDLEDYNWLAFVDGPGKGKTQIVVSILQKMIFSSKWISLRNKGKNGASHLAEQIVLWIIELSGNANYWKYFVNGLSINQLVEILINVSQQKILLVIDDLPDPVKYPDIFDVIEIIGNEIIKSGNYIITTSQRKLPSSFGNFILSKVKYFRCKVFDANDIFDLLKQVNAPDKFLESDIPIWIEVKSKGHPILITSIIMWAMKNNWNNNFDKLEELINGTAIKESVDYFQRYLLSNISEEEKELLFRLSYIEDDFYREIAWKIADLEPKVNHPNEKMNNMIGPWIEVLENDKLAISPLLHNCGKGNINFQIEQKIHFLVIDEYIENGVIEASNASNYLNHIWQARDYAQFSDALIQLLNSVKTTDQARYLNWATILLLGTEWPDEIDYGKRILIRAFQVKVSSMYGGNYLSIISDLDTLIEKADFEKYDKFIIAAYLFTGLLNDYLPMAIKMPRIFRLVKIAKNNNESLQKLFSEDLVNSLPLAVWAMGLRLKTQREVILFFQEIFIMSPDETSILFNSDEFFEFNINMIDKLWLFEVEKNEGDRNWNLLIDKIIKLKNQFLEINETNLIFACDRVLAIIFSDYLGEFEKAKSIIYDYSYNDDNDINFMINYTKAALYSDNNRSTEAITLFLCAEKSNGEKFSHLRKDNTRRLANEYSRIEDWTNAIKYYKISIKKFHKNGDNSQYKWDTFELFGELAFVYWQINEKRKANSLLFGFANGLINESENNKNSRYIESFNKLGHALGWLLSYESKGKPIAMFPNGEEYTAIHTGFFSTHRKKLGEFIPTVGHSKYLLSLQIAMFSNLVNSKKISWYIYKMAEELAKNISNDLLYTKQILYEELAILEFFYGNLKQSGFYFKKAIDEISISYQIRNRNEKDANKKYKETELNELAEMHSLYIMIIPIYLHGINNCKSEADKQELINNLKTMLLTDKELHYYNDWKLALDFFEQVIFYNGKEVIKRTLAFDNNNVLELIRLLFLSIENKSNLQKGISKHIEMALMIIDLNILLSKNITTEIGIIIYDYWYDIALTKRFLLSAPDEYIKNLDNISKYEGKKTILQVIKVTCYSLRLHIPPKILYKLNTIENLE